MRRTWFLGLAILFGLAGCGGEASPDGVYVVDVAASMEAAQRENPKFHQLSADELEGAEKLLTRIAESMQLEIHGETFTWSEGDRQRSMQAERVEQQGSAWVYEFKLDENVVTMRAAWDNGLLALESSATDDMDSYRWKRIH